MLNDYEDCKIGLVVILIAIGLFAVAWTIGSAYSSSKYNNGICKQCGGNLIYQQAVGHGYSIDYIYICNKCGHMIQTNHYAAPHNYDEPHDKTVENLGISYRNFVIK